MPLLDISMRTGKPEAYRQAIMDSLYRAMRETLDVPEDDQFMSITEHDATNFRFGNAFGVARSDDLLYVRITVFDTRTVEKKKALFRRIAERLGESRGIRPEDVFVILADAARENWSVGNGLAQFALGGSLREGSGVIEVIARRCIRVVPAKGSWPLGLGFMPRLLQLIHDRLAILVGEHALIPDPANRPGRACFRPPLMSNVGRHRRSCGSSR